MINNETIEEVKNRLVNMNKKTEQSKFAEHWNAQAESWDKGIKEGKDVFGDLYGMPAFLEFIGDIKGKHILDVGCGQGRNTRIFAKLGALVTGIDFENMILLAQKEEQKEPLGIEYLATSWEDLSAFKNNSFDLVLSTMALMDGPGYENGLKEIHRVLKNKGNLFFSITHPCFLTPGYTKIKNEQGVITHRAVTNYFKEGSWEFTWEMSKNADKSDVQKFVSLQYHRTLSTYINNLINAGFVLKKIDEPKPTEQACKQNFRLQIARDVAPSFLFVHAIKLNEIN